jgi:hypothetical protein
MRRIALSILTCTALMAGACDDSGERRHRWAPVGPPAPAGAEAVRVGRHGGTAGTGGTGGSAGTGGKAPTPAATRTPSPPTPARLPTADPRATARHRRRQRRHSPQEGAPAPAACALSTARTSRAGKPAVALEDHPRGRHARPGRQLARGLHEKGLRQRPLLRHLAHEPAERRPTWAPCSGDSTATIRTSRRSTTTAGCSGCRRTAACGSYQPPCTTESAARRSTRARATSPSGTHSEILLNIDKGTLRAATDGVEITQYTHPGRP